MALVDTGLVCRYYFDEAASGTSPTTIADASASAYDLNDIAYGTNMSWTEASGNRGLLSTGTDLAGNTHYARRAIDNTTDAVRDALQGVQTATIEIVFAPDAFSGNASRIFGITERGNATSDLGRLMLTAISLTGYRVRFNDVTVSSAIDPSISAGTRAVMHIVIDTTQATTSARVKWSVNGGTLTSVGITVAQNTTLDVGTDADLIALNCDNSGAFRRSMDGTLFYAALYTHAFSSTDITTNYDILTLDDDEPAGGTPINIAGTVDTLVIAEQAAVSKLSRAVDAGADAVVIAEQPATIQMSRIIAAGVDALTITEQQSTLAVGFAIAAGVDALTITEQAAALGLAQSGLDIAKTFRYPSPLLRM